MNFWRFSGSFRRFSERSGIVKCRHSLPVPLWYMLHALLTLTRFSLLVSPLAVEWESWRNNQFEYEAPILGYAVANVPSMCCQLPSTAVVEDTGSESSFRFSSVPELLQLGLLVQIIVANISSVRRKGGAHSRITQFATCFHWKSGRLFSQLW